jgi:drug/metabolite transporter (DMT)-like permease
MSVSPIGLFFAALVAVLLATGQVFNKKVVEGQNVAAAVFWIRLFAAIAFTVVLLVLTWMGSPPTIHAPAALVPGDIRDISSLADQLRNPANPAVQRIVNGLSEATRKQLSNYTRGVGDPELAESLRADLNGGNITRGGLLYNTSDFAGITLSAETTRVLGRGPRNEVQAYANRLLLEDLFHGAIAQNRSIALFGLKGVEVPPHTAFAIYLLVETVLVLGAQWLNSYALQISPISLCVPFTAFAPIFTLATGWMVLGEMPTPIGLMGIGLIVMGALMMHRKFFAMGGKALVNAFAKEKGSQAMLFSVMITAIFIPLEKQLILMSDSLTAVFAYGIGTVIAFWLLCMARRIDIMRVMRQRPGTAMLCGLSDASQMLAQFIAVVFLPVVITMCIKRAGIVLSVLAGWLIFRERDVTDRLIGASAMVSGVILFYLPLQLSQALTLTCLAVVGLGCALYLTRNIGAGEPILEGEPQG